MALIAPGVSIDRSEEDSVSAVEDQPKTTELPGKTEARGEIVFIRIEEPARIVVLAADEDGGDTMVKNEVRVGVDGIVQGTGILITETEVESGDRVELPSVLEEGIGTPIFEVHLRNTGLALFDGGQAEKKAGESGASAIIEAKVCGVAVGELVVTAVLEEAPHGPPVAVEIAAEFEAVATLLPSEGVAELEHGVPGVHGGGGKGIADSRVTLNREPGSAPSARATEADALKAELADVVMDAVVLRGVVHRETRDRRGKGIDFAS